MSASRGGARRILLYNWPAFVLTWAAAVVAVAAWRTLGTAGLGPVGILLAGIALGAAAWSLVALGVSHFVYGHSGLSGGAWVAPLLPASRGGLRWITLDAGLDAEVALQAVIVAPCRARFDIHDGALVGSPSVTRARALTPRAHQATTVSASSLPLDAETCDLVAVVFSAHEIRTRAARAACFREIARVLAPGGRLLLVEHLRDLANVAAYGPGAWHFLPRSEWLGLADDAGLRLAAERRVTPWVAALAFERPA